MLTPDVVWFPFPYVHGEGQAKVFKSQRSVLFHADSPAFPSPDPGKRERNACPSWGCRLAFLIPSRGGRWGLWSVGSSEVTKRIMPSRDTEQELCLCWRPEASLSPSSLLVVFLSGRRALAPGQWATGGPELAAGPREPAPFHWCLCVPSMASPRLLMGIRAVGSDRRGVWKPGPPVSVVDSTFPA